MVIKCSLLVSREKVGDCAKNLADSPPLPEFIIKTGPYVTHRGGAHKIIILYKFDKSKVVEAWKTISKQLDSLGDLSGFSFSAHVYGPHPYHLTLEKGATIEGLARH